MALSELDALRQEFSSLPDGFARYFYLIELAALLPEGNGALRQDAYRYRGCQSNVWLKVWQENGVFHMSADSDTLIIRGILYLFCAVLEGCTAQEVLSAGFDLLGELNIAEHFNSQRTAGIGALLPELKRRLGHV